MTEQEKWKIFIEEFCNNYLAGYEKYQILIKAMYKNGYNDAITPDQQLQLPEDFPKKIGTIKSDMFQYITRIQKVSNKYPEKCDQLKDKNYGKNKSILLLEILKGFYQKSQENNNKDSYQIEKSDFKKLQADLKDLNYEAQIKEFKDFLCENFNKSIGAFLIHGKDKYGQRWLVNRLIFNLPYCSIGEKVPICLKKHRHEINRVWETLQCRFGSTSSSPEDVITAIYERWKKEPVILCFDNVNEYKVRGNYLQTLIAQFWQPLVKKAISDKSDSKYPLILFLIDREGCPEKLEIELLNSFDINKVHIPVKLTELLRFKQSEIGLWVKNKDTLFNSVLSDMNLEQFIALLLQCNNDENKTPEDVLDQICGQFTTSDNLSLTWNHFEKTLPL